MEKPKGAEAAKAEENMYHLHGSDHPGMALVNTILDGRNYWPWSIGVRTALEATDKIGFIDGSIPPPKDANEYKKWKKVDSMIKSWLTHSISKELSELFVFCLSPKALWDVLEERYGVNNAPQMYHLQRNASSITQGGDSVTSYFNKLNRCWDEMGRLNPLPTCTCGKCSCDVNKRVADLDDLIKLMQFLMGLTPSFDVIRTHILNLSPTPTVNKAYAMVIADESQRQINLSYSSTSEGSSAMMARSSQAKNDAINAKKAAKKDKYCEHCNVSIKD
ncbi:uncharacterized protein G2W53_022287 [Senna tora]|uniref:Retrotransposon Copia-like N-terminal domain-containing protein n=1 Tax=Senna tora TaxID=362788 RepID=A0A834TKY9_9FABA|nr:uncharacterized protein G2W53_022287 [Senna tora]